MVKTAVIGGSLQASLLPPILEAGLEAAGVHGSVDVFDVTPEEFEPLVHRLAAEGYRGAAIAPPHKSMAAHLATRFSSVKNSMGVANALSFVGGSTFATNTEVPSIQQMIRQIEPGTALLMGAGSGARSVAVALLESGWKVRAWNRNAMRVRLLQTTIKRYGELELLPRAEPIGCQLIVNATALGSRAGEKPPVVWTSLRRGSTAMDLVYRRVPTEFLREAKLRGCLTVDGRELVAEKVALTVEWWLSCPPIPRVKMLEAAGLRIGT